MEALEAATEAWGFRTGDHSMVRGCLQQVPYNSGEWNRMMADYAQFFRELLHGFLRARSGSW